MFKAFVKKAKDLMGDKEIVTEVAGTIIGVILGLASAYLLSQSTDETWSPEVIDVPEEFVV